MLSEQGEESRDAAGDIGGDIVTARRPSDASVVPRNQREIRRDAQEESRETERLLDETYSSTERVAADCCPDFESIAHLVDINPALFSLLFGIGGFAVLDQFLKLWPETRIELLPYCSIPAAVAGGLGWGIGAHSVKHVTANLETSPFKRVCFAAFKAWAVISFFTLSEEIRIYCAKDPDDCMVSEETFWSQFMPAPILLGAAYFVWDVISPLQKFVWAARGGMQKGLVVIVDSFFSILLYTRIFQTMFMNVHPIPQPALYECGTVPLALALVLAQTLIPQHRQKFHTSITYSMTANLVMYLVKFLIAEFLQSISNPTKTRDPYFWSAIFKSIVFPLLFLTGFVFTIWYAKQFVEGWRKVKVSAPNTRRFLFEQDLVDALQGAQVRAALGRAQEDPRIADACRNAPEIAAQMAQARRAAMRRVSAWVSEIPEDGMLNPEVDLPEHTPRVDRGSLIHTGRDNARDHESVSFAGGGAGAHSEGSENRDPLLFLYERQRVPVEQPALMAAASGVDGASPRLPSERPRRSMCPVM